MRHPATRWIPLIVACAVLDASTLGAEVTKVTITSRAPVAGGRAFGSTGPYEKLIGTIEFSLDPADSHNRRIADLAHAAAGSDGRVHFSADLYVLQPVDPARGNGALLFEIANRGRKGMLGRFNRGAGGVQDPTSAADFGDGFLMKEGYTLVWVGWQFDVAAPLLRVEAPAANVSGRVLVSFITDQKTTSMTPADLPAYLPERGDDPSATLTVRDRFWEAPRPIARGVWRLTVESGRPRISLESGFEPGRVYEVDYAATGARVAGVGLAAIRDAASAFRYRTDLPVKGRLAYVFGVSQSGRFLRQFLHDGFNADERNRRVFDAVWPHIAGAGQGSFNERFAMPGYSSFPATRFPFTDLEQRGASGEKDGILAAYKSGQLPKVIYTNTSVEYWGQGRAAALTHTSIDGRNDAKLPDNVRIYLLSGTQHGEAAFPPSFGTGQAQGNPTPQGNVMRAMLRAMHQWASAGTRPPDSRYPQLRNDTLVPLTSLRFPAVPGLRDARSIEGPGQMVDGRFAPLPFLVPQVDSDGNELAGIRVPEVSVPLATTTGWNFRAERVGNASTIYALLGSYVPFARTRAERDARHDPRPAVDERYSGRDEYLTRIRKAADTLVKERFLLAEDVEDVVQRATRHWEYATRPPQTN
ncbi:MAG TPA: alpha/beta hydrolase domain-containing protein [Vicinamibacterales bacterium]|nr:alpha/beta hydrolase domain-containing protein [Vicinamibacterales bacterium]